MMGGERTFSKEYKPQTIKQVIKEGERIAEVSVSLGTSEQTICRWLREYDNYGEKSFKGSGNARVDSECKIWYGSKKIQRGLKSHGIHVNHKRIERITKENGLKAKYSYKRHGRYSKAYKASFYPSHLNRESDVKE